MTLRALARGSLLITLANLVPRLGALLLLPLYARVLTQGEFGIVSLTASAGLLLSIAMRLGLDAALLRMHHDVDPDGRRSLYATVIALSAASVASIGLLAVSGVLLVAGDPTTRTFALLAVLLGALSTFQAVPSVWFRAREQPGRYLAVALGAFAAVVATTVLLVVGLRLGALGSVLGQVAGAALPAAVAAAIAWRLRPWRFDAAAGRSALRFGLPLLPHTLAGWLLNVSDRWLLGLLLPVTAAGALAAIGVYSVGYQLGYVIGVLATSFSAAWLPFLYRQPPDAVRVLLRDGATVLVAGFAAMAAGLAIMAGDLVALVAPPSWATAAEVTRVVAFASAMHAAAIVLGSGLYVARRTGSMPLITLAAAAVNVGANLALIPALGILGAAWATFGAYATLLVLTALLARARAGTEIDLLPLSAIGLVTGAAAVVAGVAVTASGPSGVAARAMLAIVAAAAAAALAWPAARRARAAIGPPASPIGGGAEVG